MSGLWNFPLELILMNHSFKILSFVGVRHSITRRLWIAIMLNTNIIWVIQGLSNFLTDYGQAGQFLFHLFLIWPHKPDLNGKEAFVIKFPTHHMWEGIEHGAGIIWTCVFLWLDENVESQRDTGMLERVQ